MEDVKTEVMQQIEKLDELTLYIVLGFVRRLAKTPATGCDSQGGKHGFYS